MCSGQMEFPTRECRQCLRRDFGLRRVMPSHSPKSRRTKECLQTAPADGSDLDEVAQLLALGISRLFARSAGPYGVEQPTGLGRRTERVSGPENGA